MQFHFAKGPIAHHHKAYLARIEQVNEAVHVVVETNPDALDIAKSLDEERASGSIRG